MRWATLSKITMSSQFMRLPFAQKSPRANWTGTNHPIWRKLLKHNRINVRDDIWSTYETSEVVPKEKIESGTITVNDLGNLSGSIEFDLDSTQAIDVTFNGDTTITLANEISGLSKLTTVLMRAEKNSTLTFPSGWYWSESPDKGQLYMTSGEVAQLVIQSYNTTVVAIVETLNQ